MWQRVKLFSIWFFISLISTLSITFFVGAHYVSKNTMFHSMVHHPKYLLSFFTTATLCGLFGSRGRSNRPHPLCYFFRKK